MFGELSAVKALPRSEETPLAVDTLFGVHVTKFENAGKSYFFLIEPISLITGETDGKRGEILDVEPETCARSFRPWKNPTQACRFLDGLAPPCTWHPLRFAILSRGASCHRDQVL